MRSEHLEARHPEDAGLLREMPYLDPLARIVLWVLLAIPVVAHLAELTMRGIDPDELEHLHATFLVWRGEVPYRDFFEHHAPGLYYLAAPILWICGPNLSALWVARGLSLACALGALWLTARLARRIAGPALDGAGLIAACLLSWSVVFHAKAVEFRPDVPATLLVLASASVWLTGPRGLRSAILAGTLAGVASLFTQKCVVPAAGLCAAWVALTLARRSDDSQPPPDWREVVSGVVCFLGGAGLPWLIVTGLFATVGAADDLWQRAIYQLWVWPQTISPLVHLRPIVAADLTIWFAASWEVALTTPGIFRRGVQADVDSRRLAIALAVLVVCCAASLVWIKAAYPQFYLLWLPFVAILAARRIERWRQGESNAGFVLAAGSLGLALAIHQLGLFERALLAGESGALPYLSGSLARAMLSIRWGLLMLFGATLFAATHGWRSRAVFFLAILGSFYGVLRNVDLHIWPNDSQVEIIRAVNRLVPENGRVFDGFTGYGALRPHSYYYWWINDYSRGLMGERAASNELLDALRKRPPDAILVDEGIRRLPEPVTDWIKQNYEPFEHGPIWLRKRAK